MTLPTSTFMRWSPLDRNLVIALGRVEKLTGEHGEWLPDATSEHADPEYYGDDAIRYVPDGPYTNFAARAVANARKAYEKAQGDGANLSGMYWGVKKVEY